MERLMYHASKHCDEIVEFRSLTHFGTLDAALHRARSNALKGTETPMIYEVELDVCSPLVMPDLHETDHSWIKLVDWLHYKGRVVSAGERGMVFAAGGPEGNDYRAAEDSLCGILKDKGFDCIAYKNMHEDRGSTSVIVLDPASVRIVSRKPVVEYEKRASRGNPEAALAILADAPDVAPDPGDEIIDDQGAATPKI